MIRRPDWQRGVALEAVKQDIASRLRRVCENLAEADFQALVQRMAEIDLRYRLREDWTIQSEALWPSQARHRFN